MVDRSEDLCRFCELLDKLEARVGGKRRLSECNGKWDGQPGRVFLL
jgi:hypothetical protein